jgi:hypothetical protein
MGYGLDGLAQVRAFQNGVGRVGLFFSLYEHYEH